MLFLKATDGGHCSQYWFPKSEDELVEEVYKPGIYDLRPQPWLQSATERARKREAGDMDWDDLEEMEQWTRKWIYRVEVVLVSIMWSNLRWSFFFQLCDFVTVED